MDDTTFITDIEKWYKKVTWNTSVKIISTNNQKILLELHTGNPIFFQNSQHDWVVIVVEVIINLLNSRS